MHKINTLSSRRGKRGCCSSGKHCFKNAADSKVEVSVSDAQKIIKVSPASIKNIARYVLTHERVRKRCQISLLFVNNRQIHEFNLTYCGRDCPTDVISFDSSARKDELLADIIISCEAAIDNSRIFKTTPLYEAYLYVIHGILHLLGYNDIAKKERSRMQQRQESILKSIVLNSRSIRYTLSAKR